MKATVAGIGTGDVVSMTAQSGQVIELIISFGPFPLSSPHASGCAELQHLEGVVGGGTVSIKLQTIGTVSLYPQKLRSFVSGNDETLSVTFGIAHADVPGRLVNAG